MGLLILYPFIEFFAFYKFIQAYSFLDAVFLVLMTGFLGSFIIKLQGQSTFALLQSDLAQGKSPNPKVLHRALIILGGFLLVLPGMLTDVVGVLCILPGSRHLIAWYLKKLIARGALRGRFTAGFSGFGGSFGGGFRGGRTNCREDRVERVAEVIDIKPIEVTHSKRD